MFFIALKIYLCYNFIKLYKKERKVPEKEKTTKRAPKSLKKVSEAKKVDEIIEDVNGVAENNIVEEQANIVDKKELVEEPTKEEKSKMNDTDITKPYVNNSKPVIELVSALSYILFFLPFIFCRREPFALYHANQSLILWILMSILYLSVGFIDEIKLIAIPIIIIFHVLGIFYGMYNSAHGRARPFWLIGKLTIIKWH